VLVQHKFGHQKADRISIPECHRCCIKVWSYDSSSKCIFAGNDHVWAPIGIRGIFYSLDIHFNLHFLWIYSQIFVFSGAGDELVATNDLLAQNLTYIALLCTVKMHHDLINRCMMFSDPSCYMIFTALQLPTTTTQAIRCDCSRQSLRSIVLAWSQQGRFMVSDHADSVGHAERALWAAAPGRNQASLCEETHANRSASSCPKESTRCSLSDRAATTSSPRDCCLDPTDA
jgi:hypothetical protein